MGGLGTPSLFNMGVLYEFLDWIAKIFSLQHTAQNYFGLLLAKFSKLVRAIDNFPMQFAP